MEENSPPSNENQQHSSISQSSIHQSIVLEDSFLCPPPQVHSTHLYPRHPCLTAARVLDTGIIDHSTGSIRITSQPLPNRSMRRMRKVRRARPSRPTMAISCFPTHVILTQQCHPHIRIVVLRAHTTRRFTPMTWCVTRARSCAPPHKCTPPTCTPDTCASQPP